MDTWLIVLIVLFCAAPFLMVLGWLVGWAIVLWAIERNGWF